MLPIRYVELSPEEAREKVNYIYMRIWHEQYKANWFIKDIRSDVYLRNELQAFWEGRISEIHGWTDIVGQIVDAIVTPVRNALTWFYDTIIRPAFDALRNAITGFLNDPFGPLRWLFDRLVGVWNYLSSTIASGLQGLSGMLTNAWNFITTQVWNGIQAAGNVLGNVWNFITTQVWNGIQAISNALGNAWNYLSSVVGPALQSISSALKAAWDGIVTQVSGAFEAVVKGLEALPQAIAAAFQSAISWIANVIADIGSKAMGFFTWLSHEAMNAIMSGLRWIWDQITGFVTNAWNSLLSIVKQVHDAIHHSGPEMAAIIFVVAGALGAAIPAILDLAGTKVLGSGLTLRNVGEYLNKLISPDAIGGALVGVMVGTSVRTPLQQVFNAWLRPNIPDIQTATQMLWRGKINIDDFKDVVAKQGFGGKFEEGYVELTKVIPGIGDLIRFAVREAYPVEGPEAQLAEMKKYAKMQGLEEFWADRYWIAHWQLPAFDNLREAFWRGIISESEYKKFVVMHDYRPTPWPGISKSDEEIMFNLSFNLPGRMEQRWMLRWGIINKDELKNLTKMLGIHPDWLDKVVEAEIRNMLSDERSRLLTQLRSLVILGRVTEEVFKQKLKEVYYSDAEISYIIRAAELEREKEIVNKYMDASILAYRYGKITIEELARQLTDLGLNPDYVQSIITYERTRAKEDKHSTPEEEVRATGSGVAIKRFREGLTTEVELEQELKLLGYTDAQISRFKILAILERDYDLAVEALNALRQAYRKGKISPEMFYEEASKFGIPRNVAARYLTLENLKKGLGLGEAA